MTLRFSSNVASTSCVDIIFKFKEFMKTASPLGPGWTVEMSGQGTTGTYSGSGDVLTSTSVFFDKYWFVLKAPTGNREILIQGESSGSFVNLYIMYSKSAGFTGGDVIVRATATDEVCAFGRYDNTVWGLYRGAAFFSTSYFPVYIHMWGDDSNEHSFGLYCRKQGITTSTGCNNGLFIMDKCLNTNAIDIDNVAFIGFKGGDAVTEANLNKTYNITDTSGIRTFLSSRNNQNVFEIICPLGLYPSSGARFCPLGMGTDVVTSKDYTFPIILSNCGRNEVLNPYYKGFFENIMWQGANRTKTSTLTINTTNDYLVVDEVVIPWDGSTPVV